MPHPHLAVADSSVLVVIDVQEPFARALADRERLTKQITTLIRVAKIVGLPVLVTEQYPEKLGPTVPEIRDTLEELGLYAPISKMAFSCCAVDGFVQRVYDSGRDTMIITGIETHVCVQQTVLEAMSLGYKAQVVSDAVASRLPDDRAIALDKMRHAGAVVSSVEMIAYELLGQAGTPEFKAAMEYLKW